MSPNRRAIVGQKLLRGHSPPQRSAGGRACSCGTPRLASLCRLPPSESSALASYRYCIGGTENTVSRANCHKTNLEGFGSIQSIVWEEVQPCPPPGSLRAGALPSPGCDLLLTGTGCVNRL